MVDKHLAEKEQPTLREKVAGALTPQTEDEERQEKLDELIKAKEERCVEILKEMKDIEFAFKSPANIPVSHNSYWGLQNEYRNLQSEIQLQR